MTDNYDRKSEHSITANHATQAEASLPQGMEEPVLPLDTSSQTSVGGTEASVESNPAEATLVAATHNGWSDSPVQGSSVRSSFRPLILYLLLRGHQSLKGKVLLEILRLCCANMRWRQWPPMRRPKLPAHRGTSKPE